MKGKSYTTEERIYILEAVDAGGDIKEVCQENKIAEQTLRRWKRQLGCMAADETLRREKQEQKNSELKKILVDSLLMHRVLDAAYQKRSRVWNKNPNWMKIQAARQADGTVSQWWILYAVKFKVAFTLY